MVAAFSIHSGSAESSLMWHQVSKLAGSLFFIVFLDLTLQHINSSRKIKIKRFVLYLPGMIAFLYIIFQSPEINFALSQWGFIDTNQVVLLNAGIKFYSMVYFFAGIALLWGYVFRQQNPVTKKKVGYCCSLTNPVFSYECNNSSNIAVEIRGQHDAVNTSVVLFSIADNLFTLG
jgi:hypothetical protein